MNLNIRNLKARIASFSAVVVPLSAVFLGWARFLCPGCGEKVSLNGLRIGDRIDCANCAGPTLELKAKDGTYFLEEISKVTCPTCDRAIEIPEGLKAEYTVECCGEISVLPYEFGAYALEKVR